MAFLLGNASWIFAQTNGSNSSYSRFGLGTLHEPSQGFNSGMGEVGIAFRSGQYANNMNPASYAAVDSLTFLFDVGLSLQNAIMKNGNNRINTQNTSLDYIHAAFRMAPGLGLSFGFKPFSTIGYNFYTREYGKKNDLSGAYRTTHNTYHGNGGLHEAYIGVGWNPFADLSIGANVGYIWGIYEHSLTQEFYENGTASSAVNNLHRKMEASVMSYKVDFGAQYPIRLNKDNILTLGVTYGLGHTIGSDADAYKWMDNNDTTHTNIKDAFSLPHSFGVGLAWSLKDRLKVGVDYTRQQWSNCDIVQEINHQFMRSNENYMNRNRIAVGGEYMNDPFSTQYLKRVRYRAGISYTTPYYKINGEDGPSEMAVSAGFGLPVSRNRVNQSMVNVSFQWIHVKPAHANLITENYLQLKVGVTFNERWFMKWKIQ